MWLERSGCPQRRQRSGPDCLYHTPSFCLDQKCSWKEASGKQVAGIVLLTGTSFAILFSGVNNCRRTTHQECLFPAVAVCGTFPHQLLCCAEHSEDHSPCYTWSDGLYCTCRLGKLNREPLHTCLYLSQEERPCSCLTWKVEYCTCKRKFVLVLRKNWYSLRLHLKQKISAIFYHFSPLNISHFNHVFTSLTDSKTSRNSFVKWGYLILATKKFSTHLFLA